MGHNDRPPPPSPPFQLVPDVVSHDTITAIEQLLRDADPGEIVGIAYVAMYKGRRYIANTTGECHRNPTFTRGMLRALDDKLAQMVGSRLVDP